MLRYGRQLQQQNLIKSQAIIRTIDGTGKPSYTLSTCMLNTFRSNIFGISYFYLGLFECAYCLLSRLISFWTKAIVCMRCRMRKKLITICFIDIWICLCSLFFSVIWLFCALYTQWTQTYKHIRTHTTQVYFISVSADMLSMLSKQVVCCADNPNDTHSMILFCEMVKLSLC